MLSDTSQQISKDSEGLAHVSLLPCVIAPILPQNCQCPLSADSSKRFLCHKGSSTDFAYLALQIRMVRKQVVKKALVLMERIDNVRAGMLRSLLDTSHPHDGRANPGTPKDPSGEQTHIKMPDARSPEAIAEGKHADAKLTADSPTDTNAIESLAGSTSLDPSAVTLTGKPDIVEGDQSGGKQLSENAADIAGLAVDGLTAAANIHDEQDADKSASEPGEEDGTVQDIDESPVDTAVTAE